MDYLNPPVDDHGRGKMNQEALTYRLTPAQCFLPENSNTPTPKQPRYYTEVWSLTWKSRNMKKESVAFFGCNPICSHFCGSHFVFGHFVSLLINFWYALIRIQVWEGEKKKKKKLLEDLCETLCRLAPNSFKLLHVVFLWGQINCALPKSPRQTNLNP